MNFSEMNTKQLKQAREDLQKRLYPSFFVSRVTCLTDSGCYLEGGAFPAIYDVDEGLSLWGRSSRMSGSRKTITELVEIEKIIDEFFQEYRGK